MTHWRHLTGTLITFTLALALFGCGGGQSGRLDFAASDPAADIPATDDQTPAGPQATDIFPGLPALPSGESDLPGAHKVSAVTDNIQLGFEYISRSLTGATVNVDALELVSGGNVDTAFGMWQWSGFTGGLKPLDLTIDFNLPAGNEFWLLLSNYSTGQWEIRGPQTGATTSFNFTPGTGYISPGGNSYVAIIACNSNQITVNQLNVTADADIDGPCKPVNLHTTNVTKFQIALAWEEGCPAADFAGYNTYMVTGGPNVDFYKDDPGVEKLNTNPRTNPVFTKTGLTPGTTYHFRVEAVDDAGNASPLSDRLDVTTIDDPVPGAPTNLHTTTIGGTSATLAWDAPAGDADITNYKIYQDGVLVLTVGSIPTSKQVTGLDLLTEYDFEVSAVDGAAQEGPKSNICTFSTVSNQPPVADFTISPDYIGVGEDVAFNPYLSSDDTTPLNQCSASWDFDNDGNFEIVDQVPGNQVVVFQYATAGPKTAKLVLKDASGDPGEKTHDLVVNRQLNSFDLGISNGYPATVLAVDTDAAGSDIAALVNTSGALYLYQYNGSWNTIDATNEIGSDTVLDIACGNGKIGILSANLNVGSKLITWTVHEYNGSWSTPDSSTQGNSIALLSGRLAYARTSGRCSVAINCAHDPGAPSPNVWDLRIWHEKSSGGYNAVQLNSSFTAGATVDLVRDDTNTTVVYTGTDAGTQIKSASIQDAGSSNTNQQTVGSRPSFILAEANPSNSAQVFWTVAYGSSIAWGDNYGSGNGGGQTFATGHASVTSLLGMKYVADNQCEFYWVDLDSNSNDFLRRYITSTSTLSELGNGYGIADNGGGNFYSDGNGDGVFFVVTEERDGGARGYMYVGASQMRKEQVHNLINQDDYDPKSFPVVFPDDSLVCLYDRLYPNCMRADAPGLNQSLTQSSIGDDAWLSPVAACLTSDPDLMMTASYTDDSALLLNTLAKSDSSIVQTLFVTGTGKAQLVYNPDSSRVMLVYTTNTNKTVTARYWDGASWSGTTNIYAGADPLLHVAVAAKPGGEFGVAFYDDPFNLRFAESTSNGASWGAPTSLGTDPLSIYAGLGMVYRANGECAIAVERDITNKGIWVGIIPNGGSVTWESALATPGTVALGIRAFYLGSNTNPTVIYYNTSGGQMTTNGKMRVLDKGVGWVMAELPLTIHGKNVGMAADSLGNVVMTGINVVPDPRPAVAAFMLAN